MLRGTIYPLVFLLLLQGIVSFLIHSVLTLRNQSMLGCMETKKGSLWDQRWDSLNPIALINNFGFFSIGYWHLITSLTNPEGW